MLPGLRRRLGALAPLAALLAGTAQAQFDNSLPPGAPDNLYDAATATPLHDHAAPRILQGLPRAQQREPVPPQDTQPGVLQSGDASSWPRLFRDADLLITGGLTGTFGLYRIWNSAFAVPPASAASAYKRDTGWGEFFIEPGLTARYALSPSVEAYGGVAYMETGTRGTDYAGVGNTYHGDREQLYGGVRFGGTGAAAKLDLSYGQQDFVVGNSFLLAAGATNGAGRGANYLDPRNAWANAALAKATWSDLSAQVFYLKPNEAPAVATGTRLAGVNVEWQSAGPVRAAAMYAYVPESNIATRSGLNVYDLRARIHPVPGVPSFWLQGEIVWQRKSIVAATGWFLEAAYNAASLPWKPLVKVRYASFGGDRPGTATWEGFDPLYFGGSTPDWYQGSIGSMLFVNTNLEAFATTLTLNPSASTIVQLVYLNYAANQVNAPLAIPAPGAPVPAGGGVPSRGLANEFDALFTYVLSKNVNINAFAAYAAPGSGYKQLYASEGGAARGWWAIGTQFNFSY